MEGQVFGLSSPLAPLLPTGGIPWMNPSMPMDATYPRTRAMLCHDSTASMQSRNEVAGCQCVQQLLCE